METRYLGITRMPVSALGLGCMGMSRAYGGSDETAAIDTIRTAVDLGVTLIDTAEAYGPYENEILVGKAIRGIRDKVRVATKFGFRIPQDGRGGKLFSEPDSRPEHIRESVEGSLRRLGIEAIDLLYQHRIDPAIPVEEVVGTMSSLVSEGKILHIGLCEVSSNTLRRANEVHPITAVQTEYSLWSREPEKSILPTCLELGVGFVAYSPLGRGFLTGALQSKAALAEEDFRRSLPRFQQKEIEVNRRLLDKTQAITEKYRCTPAQLSLGWLLAKSDSIVPIPGTGNPAHMRENLASAALSFDAQDIAALDEIFSPDNIAGRRYTEEGFELIEQ